MMIASITLGLGRIVRRRAGPPRLAILGVAQTIPGRPRRISAAISGYGRHRAPIPALAHTRAQPRTTARRALFRHIGNVVTSAGGSRGAPSPNLNSEAPSEDRLPAECCAIVAQVWSGIHPPVWPIITALSEAPKSSHPRPGPTENQVALSPSVGQKGGLQTAQPTKVFPNGS
jgi:hypothetical protein